MSPVRAAEYYRTSYRQQSYTENPIQTQVIEGYFQKEISLKSMIIRKVNKTLCGLLGIAIVITFVSYYFAMSEELSLNKLSRQITTLNDENAELQNSMLTKAEKVIEVQAINSVTPVTTAAPKTASFDWTIGY